MFRSTPHWSQMTITIPQPRLALPPSLEWDRVSGEGLPLHTLRPEAKSQALLGNRSTTRSLQPLAPGGDTSGLRNQDKWGRGRRERMARNRRHRVGQRRWKRKQWERWAGPGQRGAGGWVGVQMGAVGTNSKGSPGTSLSMWTLRGQTQGHNHVGFFFCLPELIKSGSGIVIQNQAPRPSPPAQTHRYTHRQDCWPRAQTQMTYKRTWT